MTIRDMITKLEVLEQIIIAIDCCEEAYRADAKRYRDKAESESIGCWNDLAATAEAKAEHFRNYKNMLINQEIK